MSDKSPTNGQPLDETQYIFEADRDPDITEDEGRIFKSEADGYQSGNTVGPSKGLLKVASAITAGAPKLLAWNGSYATLALGAGGALAGTPDTFIGFTKKANATVVTPTLLNEASFSDGAVDGFTANAGDRRLLVVAIQVLDGSGSGSNVSGVTADGQAMISAGVSNGSVIGGWDSGHYGIWYLPIGDNASSDDWTIDIAYSGSPSGPSVRALVIDNIDQGNPLIYGAGYNSGSGGTLGGEFKTAGGFFVGVAQDGSFSPADGTAGPAQYKAMEAGLETISYTNGSRRVGALGVFRMAEEAVSATIEVERGQFIHGFTGLTAGGKYTMSTTTLGEIELDGDGPTVGYAKSDTELWVIDPPKRRAEGVFTGNSDQTITLGFRPSVIRVFASHGAGSSDAYAQNSFGTWNPFTGQSCSGSGADNSGDGDSWISNGNILRLGGSSTYTTALIDNVDGNGFRINFTANGVTAQVHWEAEE
jgi:hypothetical protein